MRATSGPVWESEPVTRPSAPQRQRYPAEADPPVRGRASRRGGFAARWRVFAGRYGWRAYALPLLAVLSLFAIFNPASHRGKHPAGVPAAAQKGLSTSPTTAGATPTAGSPASTAGAATAASSQPKLDKPAASAPEKPLSPLALPPGPAYATRGSGQFAIVAGSTGVVGKGQLYRYTVEVEHGATGVDAKAFAAAVVSTLSDRRSWIGTGAVALKRVDSGPVDFRISLTTPATVYQMCGHTLPVETSCYAGDYGRVALNLSRWVRGAQVFDGDLTGYRSYAVNHEVGHALGHNHAHNCLSSGLAPVMMQQTIGTKTASGRACRPNSWPLPAGEADAPGAEQVGDIPDAEFFRRNS
jgi:hypothetical protein